MVKSEGGRRPARFCTTRVSEYTAQCFAAWRVAFQDGLEVVNGDGATKVELGSFTGGAERCTSDHSYRPTWQSYILIQQYDWLIRSNIVFVSILSIRM